MIWNGQRTYALIEDNIVRNIIRAEDDTEAQEQANLCYIKAIAVECTFCKCMIGDKYVDGKFYHRDDLTEEWIELQFVNMHDKEIRELQSEVLKLKRKTDTSIDVNSCSLKELKEHYIANSKTALDTYLKAHPLISDCHGGKLASYTITEEKWKKFNAELSVHIAKFAFLSKFSDDPVKGMMWNATGEKLEEWTLDECCKLHAAWEQIIRPLIIYQQEIEKVIREAKRKKDFVDIKFDYSSADIRKEQNNE